MIKCRLCDEESGGEGTSMYGHVHKWGPVLHRFTPDTCAPCDDTCVVCDEPNHEPHEH